jgi:hypothetical protein
VADDTQAPGPSSPGGGVAIRRRRSTSRRVAEQLGCLLKVPTRAPATLSILPQLTYMELMPLRSAAMDDPLRLLGEPAAAPEAAARSPERLTP